MENTKKKRGWIKWTAAAACLGLVVAGSIIFTQHKTPLGEVNGSGSIGDTGGDGESGMYSVAVYPETEDVKEVETAEVTTITESEALSHSLAEYLPKQLPDGFHYGRGTLYETVMKSGTRYNMLRIEYITGVIPEQQFTENGGAIAPDLAVIGDEFLLLVLDFEPRTDKIYNPDEVTLSLLEDVSDVYIRYKDCYVGLFTETAETAAVLEALRSIE